MDKARGYVRIPIFDPAGNIEVGIELYLPSLKRPIEDTINKFGLKKKDALRLVENVLSYIFEDFINDEKTALGGYGKKYLQYLKDIYAKSEVDAHQGRDSLTITSIVLNELTNVFKDPEGITKRNADNFDLFCRLAEKYFLKRYDDKKGCAGLLTTGSGPSTDVEIAPRLRHTAATAIAFLKMGKHPDRIKKSVRWVINEVDNYGYDNQRALGLAFLYWLFWEINREEDRVNLYLDGKPPTVIMRDIETELLRRYDSDIKTWDNIDPDIRRTTYYNALVVPYIAKGLKEAWDNRIRRIYEDAIENVINKESEYWGKKGFQVRFDPKDNEPDIGMSTLLFYHLENDQLFYNKYKDTRKSLLKFIKSNWGNAAFMRYTYSWTACSFISAVLRRD